MGQTLSSKEDYLFLFKKINQPLRNYFSKSNARVIYGSNGVGYGKKIAEVEGFARFLWGAAPAIKDLEADWQEQIIQGIAHGTDPEHEDYWGEIHDRDQRMVEMPAIALALIHGDCFVWNHLMVSERKKVIQWLAQIFDHECADGNWQFFKVIVALVFKKLNQKYDHSAFESALEKINSCYLEDGWYQDSSRGRQDYYTPFAFHYYGLIYSTLVPNDPLAVVFQDRALRFAKEYLHFFAEDGANIAFGRSMIYRYAVVSFWSALVYANVQPYGLDVMKGLINRNLEWWLSKAIFKEDGVLNLGYTYPQLSLTEPYNSDLSPYWSNKVFLLLALPKEHEYWRVREKNLPERADAHVLRQANLLAVNDNGHTQLLNAGQPGPNYHTLSNEKYLKFAYSSQFGFSIPRSSQLKEEAAMDSMIGLQRLDTKVLASRKGQTVEEIGPFLVRNKVTEVVVKDKIIASTWYATNESNIRTWLFALDGWQLRIHRLHLGEAVAVYETGFAAAKNPEEASSLVIDKNSQYFKGASGFSGIIDLSSQKVRRSHAPADCLPNTNLMTCEMTCLPGLEVILDKGNHWLITGIYAHQDVDYAKRQWSIKPIVKINEQNIEIIYKQRKIIFPLET